MAGLGVLSAGQRTARAVWLAGWGAPAARHRRIGGGEEPPLAFGPRDTWGRCFGAWKRRFGMYGEVKECAITAQYSQTSDGSTGVGRSMHCGGMREGFRTRVRHDNIVYCEFRGGM